MDSLLAILGWVGLGAILKSIVDYFLNKKSGGNKLNMPKHVIHISGLFWRYIRYQS
jgi:hypothetical protein